MNIDVQNLDTFRENSTSLIDEIVGPLNKVKVPFSSTHGVSSKHLFHMVFNAILLTLCAFRTRQPSQYYSC